MLVHVRAWSVKLVTPPPEPEFFSNEWGTKNTNNLYLDSCSLSLLVEIRHHHISFSPPFSFFIWIPPKSSFATLPLKNLDEVQRCSELLHRVGLHHIRWILLRADLYQIDHLIYITHWRILWNLTLMCFVRLWYLWSLARWITLWLSQWTRTESCMILYVSTNPLSFLWRLNCSHVLCFCRWKSNCILQLCLPTNDALSYCEHITLPSN